MPNNVNLDAILQLEIVSIDEYYGKQGAGALFFAKDTKKFMLGYRSDYVEEPKTWGGFGGKIEDGENPKEALIREIKEEIGYLGPVSLHLVYVFNVPEFKYYNYIAVVDEEFVPDLNWEHTDYAWVEYGNWPNPLHFGIEKVLSHVSSKLKQLAKPDVEEVTLTPADLTPVTRHTHPTPTPMVHQRSMNTFTPNFINYIKSVENAQGVGYKGGMWFPHKSPEGGLPTIGFGHKIKDKDELKKYINGVSDSDINNLLKRDLEDAKAKVYKDIKSMFNVTIPLSEKQEEMLIDYVYNLGSLQGFPKLTRAVLNNDWDAVKQEYKRSFHTASGEKKELQRRNLLFAKHFLGENSMEPEQSKLHKTGLIDDDVYGYELVSQYSWVHFGIDPHNTFIIYVIGTASDALNQGHASKLLDTFFKIVKDKHGRVDVGPYTTTGEMYIKHVIERLAQQYGVRLIHDQA